jgi:hypothetical protein
MPVHAAPKPQPQLSWNFDDGSTEGLTVLSGQWSVVSQQLYVLPGSLSFIDKIVTQSDPPANIAATVEMTHISGYTSTGLLLRYQDAQHYYEIALDALANNSQAVPARGLAIYKVSTSPTQLNSLGTWPQNDVGTSYLHLLAGRFFPFDFQLNHTYRLRAEVVSNTILVYVDNQLLLSATDSDSPYTGGRAGLYSFGTEATFDNFIIQQQQGKGKGK